MAKHWKTYSISAISKALFRVNGFDADLAVALAYYVKKGRPIDCNYFTYWNHQLRVKQLPVIPQEEADQLFLEYRQLMRPKL